MYHYKAIVAAPDAQVVDAFGVVRNTEVAVRCETGHRDDLVHEALVPREFPTCGPDGDVAGLFRFGFGNIFAFDWPLILFKLDAFLAKHVSSVNAVTVRCLYDFRALSVPLLGTVVRGLIGISPIVTLTWLLYLIVTFTWLFCFFVF